MDSLDLQSVSTPLKVFYLNMFVICNLMTLNMLIYLSDILKSLNKINGNFNGKKNQFIRKKEFINKCKCYSCGAVGVYNMYNFKCDECNERYGHERNHIKVC